MNQVHRYVKTGSFRAVFAVSASEAEQFIIDFRTRLTRHGIPAEITRWNWDTRHYPGLSIWLPRKHYTAIKSLLMLMYRSGEIEDCVLPPGLHMHNICGFRMIDTYNAQGRQCVLRDVLREQTYWTSVRGLLDAQEQYKKNGNVVCDLVRTGLGMNTVAAGQAA